VGKTVREKENWRKKVPQKDEGPGGRGRSRPVLIPKRIGRTG